MSAQLRARVEAKIDALMAQAAVLYPNPTVIPRPRVIYEKRGRTAGTANYATNTIDINEPLLERHPDEMINDTVPHEFAHLVSYAVYGRHGKGHGQVWKSVMVALGQEPTRCHNLDTEGLEGVKNKQKFVYSCTCGARHAVGPVLHKKIQRGSTHYCRRCQTQLSRLPYQAMGNVSYSAARAAAAAPRAVPAQAATSPVPAAPAGTKLSACWNLYRANQRADRSALIAMFVANAGCTPAGAATYYSTCVKRWAAGER